MDPDPEESVEQAVVSEQPAGTYCDLLFRIFFIQEYTTVSLPGDPYTRGDHEIMTTSIYLISRVLEQYSR